ncbi:MAG TPA: MarR family transcriptional regulator [Methylomirabilota bacterium]|nr:MarR family transcriptional regulator [Methylomirabilota bacterium]
MDLIVPIAGDQTGLLKALLQAREGLLKQLRPALKESGLTDQQWRVMSELVRVNEISASELAAAACLRASSLSRIIKDLETRQFLLRRSHRDDLRRTMISITRRGRTVVEGVLPVAEGIADDIAARFGSERLKSVHDLSDALAVTLGGNVADDETE